MDIQQIVASVLESVSKDPQCLEQFGVDPAEAIKGATGLELTDEEVGDVVGIVGPLIEGKELDMNSVMETVGDFLGDNGGDLLGKLGGLFGGKDR
ncbi:homocitrate synthase [Raoultibacter phocaeensis]|uniref:homocitrate synthase n=1 Tax=Raoultibacter phocaeensis TaxID=2479841 RepID=UPI00111A8C6F|nr:homocitrate synthase [Raoultibacter phocaeensis]